MIALAQLRQLAERVARSSLMRKAFWATSIIIWPIGFVASYLQFRDAGLATVFWVLLGLALVPLLLASVVLLYQILKRRQWARSRRLYHDHQRRVEMLTELIDEFAALEKAKHLADKVAESKVVRVLSILRVEGQVGVLLDIGKEEDLQAGTILQVYRMDEHVSDGEHIEQKLGLVQVTYVQANNNCSQAIVLSRHDREYWDQMEMQLGQQRGRIDPPRNFVVPYIPAELSNLSLEDLRIFRQYLEDIRSRFTYTVLDQAVREENLQ